MAFKEIYIDPAIAGNSGSGTIGDPYGDLDYAIVQETQGTTGTRLNIKRGTDEVLTRELGSAFADTSVSAAWAYSFASPIILQGYDTSAGDLSGTGNRSGISGNGTVMVLNGASAINVSFIDIHAHNTGTNAAVIRMLAGSIIRCEIDNNTGRGIYTTGASFISASYVHDVSGSAIDVASSFVNWCIVTNTGAKTCTTAINALASTVALNNIISIDGASDGITCTDRCNIIRNNTIFSAAGTGQGIYCTDTDGYIYDISNNLIEGFSGTGGIGILFAGTKPQLIFGGRNLIYNCATSVTFPGDYTGTHDKYGLAAIYEDLAASPFTDAANFDFSPVDTGNVKEGAYPPAFMTI